MEYSDEDYARLYNTARERERSRPLTWWEWLVVAALAVGLGAARDGDGAVVTAAAEQAAHEQSQLVLGMPCTWVCQRYHEHEPCGQAKNTRCAPADLRSAQ